MRCNYERIAQGRLCGKRAVLYLDCCDYRNLLFTDIPPVSVSGFDIAL